MADVPTNTFGTPITQAGGSVIPTGPAPISVSSVSAPQSAVTIPPPPALTNSYALNASIPTPASIIADANAPTAAEKQQTGILNDTADLTKNAQSLTTYQTAAESAAGLPAQAKTVNDLSVKLQGLSDQLDYMNNIAPTTIQNQEQQNVQGRGVTTGGLAPITAGDLRQNQIQAAAIAAQSLTVKSAYYAAQGNYTLAKDAADKAAQVKFDAQQQQLNYQQALLAAIQPQLTKDQAQRAATISANLADRQTQLNLQIDNYKTGQAAIADALKNNPNDAQAHAAAQQAMGLDPHDPQYLQKVQQLVAPYASDLTKRALDIQLTQGQVNQLPLDQALKQAQLESARVNTAIAQLQLTGNGALVQNNTKTTQSGLKYIDGTSLTGKDAQLAQRVAAQNGIPYMDKDQADALANIDTARTNLQNIATTLQGISPSSGGSRLFVGPLNALQGATQIGPQADQIASFNAYRSAAIQALRAMAGSKGLRINQAEIQLSLDNDIPKLSDTQAVRDSKLQKVNSLLDSQEQGLLGMKPAASTQQTLTKSGKPFDVAGAKAAGYSDQEIQAYINSN